ncbi:hypothetical protein RFI_30201 [Reticulomyxa filosa]|uniref:Uncharacterized protein n=1 Tax=Reticulomyxa filosa TaxID=46433 RepID=X6M2I2_RETFI|nr:hypothetical protein RFI_30201 [Reticulomyxa filosa]|eukprot:ETO07190.1 hypothetical protein RFI_30201 [Reticulomyxa filosa]
MYACKTKRPKTYHDEELAKADSKSQESEEKKSKESKGSNRTRNPRIVRSMEKEPQDSDGLKNDESHHKWSRTQPVTAVATHMAMPSTSRNFPVSGSQSPNSPANYLFNLDHEVRMDSIYDLPAVATFDEANNARQRYREQFGSSGKAEDFVPRELKPPNTDEHNAIANVQVVSHKNGATPNLDLNARARSLDMKTARREKEKEKEKEKGKGKEEEKKTEITTNMTNATNVTNVTNVINVNEKVKTEVGLHSNGSEQQHKWKPGDIVDVIIREENNLVVQGVIRSWNPVTSWADIQVLPDKHHEHGGDTLRFVEVQDMHFTGLQLNDIAVLHFNNHVVGDRQYPPGFMLPFDQLREDKQFDDHTIDGWQNGTIPLPKPSTLFNGIKVLESVYFKQTNK